MTTYSIYCFQLKSPNALDFLIKTKGAPNLKNAVYDHNIDKPITNLSNASVFRLRKFQCFKECFEKIL